MNFGKTNSKIRGTTIGAGVRLGWYCPCTDSVFYLKIGGCNFKTELRSNDYFDINISKSGISPTVGFGFEKSFSNGFGANMECDWLISQNKKFDIYDGYGYKGRYTKINNKSKRFLVRVGCVYHVD